MVVGSYHFDTSRVLIPTVTFVPALMPLMVVAPKENAGLPVETATGLPPGGGVVELLDGPLLQPPITMVAAMTPAITALFIKRNAAQRSRRATHVRLEPRRSPGVGCRDLLCGLLLDFMPNPCSRTHLERIVSAEGAVSGIWTSDPDAPVPEASAVNQ